jgi:7-cyano-7-deazaguanine reductase
MMELGRQSAYISHYTPELLFPIPRVNKRLEIGIQSEQDLPFFGYDIWNHYEVSWLNAKGKPMAAVARIIYNCHSPYIIESKSMKLYFNSFNQTCIETIETLEKMIARDISERILSSVQVKIYPLDTQHPLQSIQNLTGTCLDDLDISCDEYLVNPSLLKTHDLIVEESLYSHLLKSNCLVTLQPDWGSIQIHYQGPQIDSKSLLRYIVSFRNHNEFHEQCIERIFIDLLHHCRPTQLTIIGRYTRRGGLDINPIRSTEKNLSSDDFSRLVRQ